MSFNEHLHEKIKSTGTSVCVGIDPHLHQLPHFFQQTIQKESAIKAVEKFSQSLILACKNTVPAVKFQSSFFEALGWQGFKLLEEQIEFAKSFGLITILDAKRGDISSTMLAYGQMAFDRMKADCLTVTPYMGMDVIKPLVPWLEKNFGIYLVWLTSNPSGLAIQSHQNNKQIKLVELILDQLENEFSSKVNDSIGLVLGATKLEIIEEKLLTRASRHSLLAPGFGAQGGKSTQQFEEILQQQKHLIPISRGIAGIGEASMQEDLDKLQNWDDYQQFVAENCRKFSAVF